MKTWIIAAAVLVSLVVAALGLAAVLDLVSLRTLAADTDIDRLSLVVEHARALVSHRKAQGLELAAGFTGIGLLAISLALLLRQWQRHSNQAS